MGREMVDLLLHAMAPGRRRRSRGSCRPTWWSATAAERLRPVGALRPAGPSVRAHALRPPRDLARTGPTASPARRCLDRRAGRARHRRPLGELGRPGRRLGGRRPGRGPLDLGLRRARRRVPRPGPGKVEAATRLLNGADVFAWNVDKAYLAGLGPVDATGTAGRPTELAADATRSPTPYAEFGTSVVKPRVGASGVGVIVVDDPDDPRLAPIQSHPSRHARSVGRAAAGRVGADRGRDLGVRARRPGRSRRWTSCPAGDEIRVHEQFGGASRPVPLRDECADLARPRWPRSRARCSAYARLRAGRHAAARRRHGWRSASSS